MAKFSLYNIQLLKLSQGKHIFEYELDRKFFDAIDGDEVKKGCVKVLLTVHKTATTYEFDFDIKGIVQIPCNRCLDEMNQEIDTQNRLIVKLGHEYSEESDEVIVIPEDDGEINIAWFLYEFVALNIPIKHVHEPGKCNRTMSTKLRKHRAVNKNDEDDDESDELDASADDDYEDNEGAIENIDPRWEGLKGLNLEDN
ncbi:MAG: DUF177 domain-containing protein [Bacteroidia bacterium]|nr:DUF177 domain-containing protein [Bacteroidia bacterium]